MRRFHGLLISAGLAAMPASAAARPSTNSWTPHIETYEWSSSGPRLGVTVMSLTPELRKHFGAMDDRGVLVSHVEPGTPAATAGLAVGDVIVSVRGRTIERAADVIAALADAPAGEAVAVEVMRDTKPVTVQATIDKGSVIHRSQRWMRELMKPRGFDAWFEELMRPFHPAKSTTSLRT